jgi:hypothetical protein
LLSRGEINGKLMGTFLEVEYETRKYKLVSEEPSAVACLDVRCVMAAVCLRRVQVRRKVRE